MLSMTYRVEFHCHTKYSKDSLISPLRLVESCRSKGIDKVVVTDHNTIKGALEAQKIAPDLVIVGEEIMTTKGELLAAYLEEEIPAGLSPKETIKRLRHQGAFVSIAHPFDFTRGGYWRKPDLLDIVPLVDAIETFNARCFLPHMNHQSQEIAEHFNVASTVGSDAHVLFELGRATMVLPEFDNAQALREVIRHGVSKTKISCVFIRATSRYAVIHKKVFQ